MSLVGFATDRGFGHWSRMRNYITLPSLRDKALMIAPIAPASLSWKEVNTIGYVDSGKRVVLDEDGNYKEIRKYDPSINFDSNLEHYYLLPWCIARAYRSKVMIIDAHNEPELVYCEEIFPRFNEIIRSCLAHGLRILFTLETQAFNKLPLRYKKAFERLDSIIIPYEKDFFTKCVPLEPFEEFYDKIKFVGNIISPDLINMLRIRKEDARKALNLPEDKRIVFCTYGRGEGAQGIVNAIVKVGDEIIKKYPELFFIISDPTGEFRRLTPKRDWIDFIGLDYQKAMMTLSACDFTIQGLGTGTLMEALVAGKPMIAISLDRPYQEQASKGKGIQEFGIGIYMPLDKVSVKSISEALIRILEEDYGKLLPRVLPKVLGDLKGAERVANLLSSYL
ncbi:MAG: glycosyltransferase [Nitrososphaerales archaeon]